MNRPPTGARPRTVGRLTLPPQALDARLTDLGGVYRRAHAGAAAQRAVTAARLRTRITTLVTTPSDAFPPDLLTPDDLFDPRSGGVRLREWELPAGPELQLTRRLFCLPGTSDDRAWLRRLQTDSAILLRGGLYYFPYAMRLGEPPQRYVPLCASFLDQAGQAATELGSARRDLTAFKLLLGIHDTLRAMLLHLLTAGFLLETEYGDADYPVTRQALATALAHTSYHTDLLVGAGPSHDPYERCAWFLEQTAQTLRILDRGLSLTDALTRPESSTILLRERHSDDLLENIAAVDLGMGRLLDRCDLSLPVRCVGLVAGGTELALLALTALRRSGVAADLQLLRLSLYQEAGRTVQDWDTDLTAIQPATLLASPDSTRPTEPGTVVVLDDNILTGRTLSAAWRILSPCAEVRGAVVTRYPGPTMLPHLRMHGFPNPDELLHSIRGLLTPLPAGRIGKTLVNKSEQRILHYLARGRKEPST